MADKKTVVLLFGGRSSEHEISCVTATGVLRALDRELFEPIMVGITKQGSFVHVPEEEVNFRLDPEQMPAISDNGRRVLWPDSIVDHELRVIENGDVRSLGTIDVVFPLLHGPFGEDGTVQGMLELLDIAYVGAGVLASSVCMDKHVTKILLQAAGVKVAPWNRVTRLEYENGTVELSELDRGLKYPLFVKPARAGSSVGVSRVTDNSGLAAAIEIAFKEDSSVLVEEGVAGRELEIAVLQGRAGSPTRVSSVLGEIVFQGKEFYDYEAKYLGSAGVRLELPANVTDSEQQEIAAIAKRAFAAVAGTGLARIDFFWGADGPVLNEINTMPGFTPISMYPQLWEHSGLAYSDLVTELIELALER